MTERVFRRIRLPRLPPPCGETMALGLMVWVCSLPLVGLVVWAFDLGLHAAVAGALLALGAVLVGCWAICIHRTLATLAGDDKRD